MPMTPDQKKEFLAKMAAARAAKKAARTEEGRAVGARAPVVIDKQKKKRGRPPLSAADKAARKGAAPENAPGNAPGKQSGADDDKGGWWL